MRDHLFRKILASGLQVVAGFSAEEAAECVRVGEQTHAGVTTGVEALRALSAGSRRARRAQSRTKVNSLPGNSEVIDAEFYEDSSAVGGRYR